MPAVDTLTTKQFERIAVLAKRRWGLALTANKMQLVSNRLASFLRKSEFTGITEYLEHLEHGASEADMLMFFDLLSTNVTSFFRDRMHFDYLERELFTALARGNLTLPGRKLRLWSAGCSTGCEPYTMAMVAYDSMRDLSGWDVQILATDLSNKAVSAAKAGAYREDVIKTLPKNLLSRHFERQGDHWVVRQHLRDMVKIAQLNLMGSWPMSGPFDVIFCRNVMIYFDGPTRASLVDRFASLLRPRGLFAVGSAETLAGMDTGLKPVVPSMYSK